MYKHRRHKRRIRLDELWVSPIVLWYEQFMIRLTEGGQHGEDIIHRIRANKWITRMNKMEKQDAQTL